jgi:TrmH family RNA methyltransferase
MNPKNLHSIKEESIVAARSLHSARERLSQNRFLIEGEEQVRWAIEHSCSFCSLFVHDKCTDHPLVATFVQKGVPVFFVSEGIMKKISDTSYLVPWIGVAEQPIGGFPNKELVIVLDGVQDFGNLGTIIRTAEAFGIKEFISVQEDFDWHYKKTIDASRGQIFSAHLHRCKSRKEAISKLKAQGYQIAVTTLKESRAQPFASLDSRPLAIVFGNETSGVSPEIEKEADVRIQIPMSGSVESLNVAVAAGISLYELKIKWILAMLTQKIQESIGKDLSLTSKWLRLVFDAKLKAATPFNADQAIMMMVLKCDQTSNASQLAQDAGIAKEEEAGALIQALLEEKLIDQRQEVLSLSEKGEETIAKIWSFHELAERLAFEGISGPEKETFLKVLRQMQDNCGKIVSFS